MPYNVIIIRQLVSSLTVQLATFCVLHLTCLDCQAVSCTIMFPALTIHVHIHPFMDNRDIGAP